MNDMSSVQESEMADIASKIKEAEAYHSHGLVKESLDIYEQVLSIAPELGPDLQKEYEEKKKA